MKNKIFLFFILILTILTGCTSAKNPSPQISTATERKNVAISLPVGYIPNVQFAPLYVGIEKGFFSEEGIELSMDYSMENDNAVLLATDEVHFAILSGEQVLLGRGNDLPLVYVMAWYQQYPVGIVSKSSSNIISVSDLKGKKIGLPGLYGASYIGAIALLNAAGIRENEVTLDSIGYNQVDVLMADRDDAVVIYTANEPVQLEHLGQSINLLKVSDYSELVANGLVTNEKTLNENPEIVQAMVNALLKSIQYSQTHPDEAYAISEKYVENLASADQDIQKQVLLNSIEHWKADRMGFSEPEAWENMQNILLQMGMLTKTLDLEICYTNEFIP